MRFAKYHKVFCDDEQMHLCLVKRPRKLICELEQACGMVSLERCILCVLEGKMGEKEKEQEQETFSLAPH